MKTLTMTNSRSLLTLMTLVSTFALGACAVSADSLEDAQEEEIGSAEQALIGWTPFTSEEYAPLECDPGALVSALQFTGSYSDNVRLYCQPANASWSPAPYWSPSFSEETPQGFCDWGYMMSGVACSGSNCDNVSLRCSYLGNIDPASCHWTEYVSEENGGYLYFPAGFYARGARCSGRFCDSMQFNICAQYH